VIRQKQLTSELKILEENKSKELREKEVEEGIHMRKMIENIQLFLMKK
jgi:hypothetical protein